MTEAKPRADRSRTEVLQLLEEYVRLTGSALTRVAKDVYEFQPASLDRELFLDQAASAGPGNSACQGEALRVAFSVGALEREPAAQMAVVGSGFFNRLVQAVRSRGHRQDHGFIEVTHDPSEVPSAPGVPIHGATASIQEARLEWVPLGHMAAMVALRAGNELEERIVETGLLDLRTGSAAALLLDPLPPTSDVVPFDAPTVPHPPLEDLVEALLAHLETRMAGDIRQIETKVARALAEELGRLDGYYRTLERETMERPQPDIRAIQAIRREHALRREEQVARHSVRAVVKPFQLTRAYVLAQSVVWELAAPGRAPARFQTTRMLSGSGAWQTPCPTCAAPSPRGLHVCVESHVSCDTCTDACSVCDEFFCDRHGLSACHVDGAAACVRHAATCISCDRAHCSEHRSYCTRGAHEACSVCVEPCASCGTQTCELHSTRSQPEAPLGARRLCSQCVRACEGGAGEVVGLDEVVGCTTCDRVICTNHQVRCAVDRAVHCSAHLRRTDGSRRLVCEGHRGRCSKEPEAVFASDEVQVCPICERPHCTDHRGRCELCVRDVCLTDMHRGRCHTCRGLEELRDPDDALIHASLDVREEGWGRPIRWRVGRDATHRVASVTLSAWRRTLVIAVPHGSERAERAVLHGVFRQKRLR